jgi:hypothetical protein
MMICAAMTRTIARMTGHVIVREHAGMTDPAIRVHGMTLMQIRKPVVVVLVIGT